MIDFMAELGYGMFCVYVLRYLWQLIANVFEDNEISGTMVSYDDDDCS